MMLAAAVAVQGQTSSVLATGDWWRIEVGTCGVYRLTVADVPQLQGVQTSAIGLYGAGGEVLSLYNSETPTHDLQPVAIDIVDHNGNGVMDSGDELLFYGEGTGLWRYHDGDRRWEWVQHPYAVTNSYYLTTSAPETSRIAMAPAVTPDITVGTHTAVTHIDNDLVNIYKSGQLWMGEKFSMSLSSRSFTLSLGATATDLKVRYALASVSSVTSRFSVRCGSYAQQHHIQPATVYTSVLEALPGSASTATFDVTF